MDGESKSLKGISELASQSGLGKWIRKKDWVFDPIPSWFNMNREQQERFARLQIDFKIKELQVQQEKLQAIRELM